LDINKPVNASHSDWFTLRKEGKTVGVLQIDFEFTASFLQNKDYIWTMDKKLHDHDYLYIQLLRFKGVLLHTLLPPVEKEVPNLQQLQYNDIETYAPAPDFMVGGGASLPPTDVQQVNQNQDDSDSDDEKN